MKVIIASDGGCRRPGTPECIAAGGAFARPLKSGPCKLEMVYEEQSTSQRGELLGMIKALEMGLQYMDNGYDTIYIVSDSEYVVKGLNNEWFIGWAIKGWVTSQGTPVKNRDLWEVLASLKSMYTDADLVVYHIRGHVIPFGAATARNLLEQDSSATLLFSEAVKKCLKERRARDDSFERAKRLFVKSHDIAIPEDTLIDFVASNVTIDMAVKTCVSLYKVKSERGDSDVQGIHHK